jgi:hypothetical protein
VRSLQALGSLFDFELDRLAFLKGAEPIGLYGAVVDKNIRAAFACEEAVALRRIEPFDRTGHTLCHFIASPYLNKKKNMIVVLGIQCGRGPAAMVYLKNTDPCGLLLGRLPAIPARTLTTYIVHFIWRVEIRQDFRDNIKYHH